MNGIILLYKEKGPSSFEAVQELKKKFNLKKIGHSGTLDPLAEGLLVALVNSATKINEYLHYTKEYSATVAFGRQTSTDDLEGEIVREAPVPEDLKEKLTAVLPSFMGEITQRPPAFSAISVNGKRLYELARAGKPVEAPLRKVKIFELEVISVKGSDARIRVLCSTGTYIRSIARDLGEALGSAATLSFLKRTKVGKFRVEDAVKLADLKTYEEKLISTNDALYEIPAIDLTEKMYEDVKHGIGVPHSFGTISGIVKLVYKGEVAALAEIDGAIAKVKRGI
ncbi:MAG: tRNA pseudouridine(55) synthase TruB [bacterium]